VGASERKDLTAGTFDEDARWMTLERRDPSAPRSLLLCNCSASSRRIPMSIENGKWLLALWTGTVEYGGDGGSKPVGMIDSGSEVILGGYAAALYTDRVSDLPADRH
jgi:hypothetical protein